MTQEEKEEKISDLIEQRNISKKLLEELNLGVGYPKGTKFLRKFRLQFSILHPWDSLFGKYKMTYKLPTDLSVRIINITKKELEEEINNFNKQLEKLIK